MKLQQLAQTTSTPVSTVKYYLREGLLPPGRKLNATTAAYGPEHVERLELIRALRQLVGLSLARVRQVVEAVEVLDPVPLMGRVQTIVLDLPEEAVQREEAAQPEEAGAGMPSAGHSEGAPVEGAPAAAAPGQDLPGHEADRLTSRDILGAMGWQAGTPEALQALDGQLAAMAAWGLRPSLETALVYARAADDVAAYQLTATGPWARQGGADVAGDGPASGTGAGGDAPPSPQPSKDRIATYVAVGVHAYAQLLLRLLSVAQGAHARGHRPAGR